MSEFDHLAALTIITLLVFGVLYIADSPAEARTPEVPAPHPLPVAKTLPKDS